MTVSEISLEKLIDEARKRRESQLPDKYRLKKDQLPHHSVKDITGFFQQSGLFTKHELTITESPVEIILKAIKDQDWTSVEVAEAFCKRAAYTHQITNCLTEMFFDRAVERAKYLDDYYAQHGKLFGPLHGLPVSIKDHHQIKGTTVTIGFTAWSTTVSSEDSAIITMLYELGAVLYCKTTVPVAMMMPDTESHLFGRTLNPNNLDHSPGGSSGGEGALLACCGAPIGLGSDIGGSIRLPAHSNGIYGLKPTASRFPIAGTRSGLRGQHTIKSVVGPLSRSLESLEYFTKLIFNSNPENYDPTANPIPWREPIIPEKLVFGVIRTDNYVEPTPAVKRAVERTVAALESQGHEVIEWEPYMHARMDDILDKTFVADGGKFVKSSRQGEPLFPYMEPYGKVQESGCSLLWELNYERSEIEMEYFKRWQDSGKLSKSGRRMDGIIVPASPVSSHPPHHFSYVGYTSVFNAIDYPAVVYPVLKSDSSIDGKPAHEPLSEKDRKVWEAYNPEEYDNGCVGLQIVCRRHEDEKALALAKVIRDALQQ
ncbi:Amd2p [Sugiyamaella lignohabitans]|uniref:amidase n=1 Tax=Sugiyamaella lignohabitans TaxID=796027 RepID=A0A167F0C9_9ASCO|nr:Amd2p [Sugiyamaella lignohabitans]ANB14668.1 Amd2p [Sugiyamaella lignohabitans]